MKGNKSIEEVSAMNDYGGRLLRNFLPDGLRSVLAQQVTSAQSIRYNIVARFKCSTLYGFINNLSKKKQTHPR